MHVCNKTVDTFTCVHRKNEYYTCVQYNNEYHTCVFHNSKCHMCRVGQNRTCTYIYTVCLVISKPKIPYVHRIYLVLANPTYVHMCITTTNTDLASVLHITHSFAG